MQENKDNINNEGSVGHILRSRHLSDKEFEIISKMIYDLCRINLHSGKKELVQARMNKRLRQLGMDTYTEYLKHLEADETGRELTHMVDILSTNLTYFFREPDHFDFIKDELKEKLDTPDSNRFRIWSAGCSSGEEAYTLAMVLNENVPGVDKKDVLVLATDISTRMLAVAQEGVYREQRFRDTPQGLKSKYFNMIGKDDGGKVYQAMPELSNMIRFRHLNLMGTWPMQGQFDIILCRNVMIYFDKITQGELVKKFYDKLRVGGLFIVGHSESLTGIDHNFKYVKPTVYRKI